MLGKEIVVKLDAFLIKMVSANSDKIWRKNFKNSMGN